MYITRLLFNNSSRCMKNSSIRSLLGTLILSSCSRSLLLSSRSSNPQLLFVHCYHHHNVHHLLRLTRNATTSLPNLTIISPLHTSSSMLLSASEAGGIASPKEKPDESDVVSTDARPSNPPTTAASASSTTAPANNSSLTITDRCRARLQSVLDPDEVLRIGVRGGGCSGFEYEISVVKRDTINPEEDIRFEDKVVVDSESIEYMNGAKLDYEEELIRSGFRVVANPLAEKGCSCGASFSLKF